MRRLRENTELETEIGKSGEVVVEGHAIGRLDGLVFTPDASTAGSEARALAGAAQKALAGEINARATRIAQAADGQFVLSSDGTLRWLGQALGKLVASEELLKPRVRIVADDHLTGAPRDAVQGRLDLWLKSHIERVLEPLFRLAAADDVTGIARGVAFQLTEALGVLDRQKVADEVKGLDQTARSTLRKYGVRFGAYHIYVPSLLKPAPRVLAMQLWRLKHGGSEAKGLETVEQLAASGRTSIAADKEIAKVLYRTAGYRVCGERAVRVDILERLADLIRPALAWRTGAAGAKPPGAIDGFGFTVSVGMTSLAGCSGENFASVLRSLGYRMDKRPKPMDSPEAAPASAEPEPGMPVMPAETVSSEVVPSELVSVAAAEPAAHIQTDAMAQPAAGASASDASAASADEGAIVAADAIATVDVSPPTQAEAIIGAEPSMVAVSEQAGSSSDLNGTPQAQTSGEVAATSELAAQEFIEVWRPGRRDEHHPRKPRPERRTRRAHPQEPAVADAGNAIVASNTDSATAGPSSDALQPSEPRRGNRHRERRADRSELSERRQHSDRASRPQQVNRADRADRDRAPQRERDERAARSDRPDRKPRGDRPDRQARGDRPDRDPELRAKYIKGREDGWRDREPDPNSPFAKLAALKEQLEANKEPR
jgi:ATP-dependent RNA helicase SUPV3L1/SUV3